MRRILEQKYFYFKIGGHVLTPFFARVNPSMLCSKEPIEQADVRVKGKMERTRLMGQKTSQLTERGMG